MGGERTYLCCGRLPSARGGRVHSTQRAVTCRTCGDGTHLRLRACDAAQKRTRFGVGGAGVRRSRRTRLVPGCRSDGGRSKLAWSTSVAAGPPTRRGPCRAPRGGARAHLPLRPQLHLPLTVVCPAVDSTVLHRVMPRRVVKT